MARLPRYVAPGQPQHVIQRGNNRSALFTDATDYGAFLHVAIAATSRHGCSVHAYVLMPNHVHFLMTPDRANGIGKALQSIGRRDVSYFNHRYERTGTWWEGRYRATLIDTEAYLLTCYRYIELNPVRAGLVDDPGEYRWSSHARNAFGEHDPLATPHERYLALGLEPAAHRVASRALFRDALDLATLGLIRGSTNGAWALGGDRLEQAPRRPLNRRALPRSPGRPRSSGEPRPDAILHKSGSDSYFGKWESDPDFPK